MKILAFLILVFVVMVPYYASFVNFSKLYSEIEIERWADNLRDQGGVGKNCSYVNYGDINRILDSTGRKRLESDSGINLVELPINCLKNIKLIEMTYYAEYNVVSGVYRCEKDDMIQEVQLAVYLEPKYVPQENDCMVGKFLKAWNIPVGEATMFSLP